MRGIFGVSINGAGVVDSWRACISVLQRCWAYQMREVDAFVEKPGGKEPSEAIHKKFKTLKGFLGEEPLASYGKAETAERSVGKIAELAAKQFASSRN